MRIEFMKRTLFAAFVSVVVLVFGNDGRMPVLENGITAHRGDSISFPENSLLAFSSGCNIGADWIETDVRKNYPLKVARLPIPPFLQLWVLNLTFVVPRTRLELARLSTLAPETSASTIPPPGQALK